MVASLARTAVILLLPRALGAPASVLVPHAQAPGLSTQARQPLAKVSHLVGKAASQQQPGGSQHPLLEQRHANDLHHSQAHGTQHSLQGHGASGNSAMKANAGEPSVIAYMRKEENAVRDLTRALKQFKGASARTKALRQARETALHVRNVTRRQMRSAMPGSDSIVVNKNQGEASSGNVHGAQNTVEYNRAPHTTKVLISASKKFIQDAADKARTAELELRRLDEKLATAQEVQGRSSEHVTIARIRAEKFGLSVEKIEDQVALEGKKLVNAFTELEKQEATIKAIVDKNPKRGGAAAVPKSVWP